jgi:hypothetical protein
MDPADLPRTGTFWWVLPGGYPTPAPCPPLDLNVPIYQMAASQFLVDETGGQVTLNSRLAGRSTVSSALATQANTVLNLIAQAQTTAANQQMRTMSLSMGMNVPSFNDTGDGGGTNGFYSDSFNFHPDYGTNLWIANFARSTGNASGIVSNTAADVQYELQYTTDLLQP